MKLAVIITGSNYKRVVGIHKIALTRASLLLEKYNYSIDYFYLDCIEVNFNIIRFLKGDIGHSTAVADGRFIHLLHKYEFKPTNKLNRKFLKLFYHFFKRRFADWEWQQDLGKYIKGYDLITAHFNDAAIIAYGAKKRYNTPYCVTWHGSDIHTIPFNDPDAKEKTIIAMESAECNFFVSNALLKTSDKLTINARKEVIYNGVDDCFVIYPEEKRKELRMSFNVINKKVVTFAGNLIAIKNAELLPDIFDSILKQYGGDVVFWIIGQGNLDDFIRNKIKEYNLPCQMWGFVEPNRMPEFFNCTDVLVLPSKNEGLPLVTIEAIKCGANVVGSNVGGISEVIGVEHAVNIDERFVEMFSKRVVDVLKRSMVQSLSENFEWNNIVLQENRVYNALLC